MDDFVLKCAEFGILGVIVLLLLTRGLTALNELSKTTAMLSKSHEALAGSINTLADKVSGIGMRISNVGYQIEGVERRLEKLEENFARNFNELRELIKGNCAERSGSP